MYASAMLVDTRPSRKGVFGEFACSLTTFACLTGQQGPFLGRQSPPVRHIMHDHPHLRKSAQRQQSRLPGPTTHARVPFVGVRSEALANLPALGVPSANCVPSVGDARRAARPDRLAYEERLSGEAPIMALEGCGRSALPESSRAKRIAGNWGNDETSGIPTRGIASPQPRFLDGMLPNGQRHRARPFDRHGGRTQQCPGCRPVFLGWVPEPSGRVGAAAGQDKLCAVDNLVERSQVRRNPSARMLTRFKWFA